MRLRCAFPDYPHTRLVAGPEIERVQVGSIVSAYRRMAREVAYDVCEMAPLTYLAAYTAGVPILALPIFLFRRFHHGAVVCWSCTGPRSLEGRRVGVRAYSVTTALWTRAIWQHEYGVDLSRITWVTDDVDNSPSATLPDNVERLPAGSSLRSRFAERDLDAAFLGAAGIGRQGPPGVSWTTAEGGVPPDAKPVIADWPAAQARWFARTGIYPLHGLLAVRRELVEQHPDLVRSLYLRFERAKRPYLAYLSAADEDELTGDDRIYREYLRLVGDDPLPYGLAANRRSLNALLSFAAEQGFITEPPAITDLFWE